MIEDDTDDIDLKEIDKDIKEMCKIQIELFRHQLPTEIKKSLNKWLALNPDVKIISITQVGDIGDIWTSVYYMNV